MKKLLILTLVVLMSLVVVSTVSAGGAKNGECFTWVSGGENVYGCFLKTGSGIVHMWSYDRTRAPLGDVHFIFKPLPKFQNSTCDIDSVYENYNYTPVPLNNLLGGALEDIFDIGSSYIGCAYNMD